MRRQFFSQNQGGFTLIEVMLVIAIMAIMASLIVMSVQGIEHRKVMQAKELLILDLQKIRLESLDQNRLLGLHVLPATDIAPASYQVLEYVAETQQQQNILLNQNQIKQNKKYSWKAAQDFQIKALPSETSLTIEMLDNTLNLELLKQNEQLPHVIWLGNGEVIPARFQLYLQQQAIGDAIELNRLGMVVNNE